MKAAVWYGQKDVRVEDVEVKACEPDEVRVKVAFTGICGSDLHEFLEGSTRSICKRSSAFNDGA